jgi:hypothetical protein
MQYHAPYGVTDTNAPYINGDPSVGRAGSIPPAESIEYPQREIVNLIADAGLAAPDDSDLHQLSRSVQSMLLISDDDAGTANAYQVTMSPAPTAYFKYMTIVCQIANTNTGTSVLNVNALGPKPIVHIDGTQLSAAELKQHAIVCFVFDGTSFQMVWASTGIVGQGVGPIYLTAPKDWYVNGTTGSDSNDGSAAVVGGGHGPFATIGKAFAQIPLYNMNGYNVTVHIADGVYVGYCGMGEANGSGLITITGNPSSPSNVDVRTVGSTTMNIQTGNIVLMSGLKISNSGTPPAGDPGNGLGIAHGTEVYADNMEFGQVFGSQIFVAYSSIIGNYTAHTPWKISGGAGQWHCVITSNSRFAANANGGPNITIPSAISFGSAFLICDTQSNASYYVGALTGAANVTGKKFYVWMNSTINSGGGGINLYPGTIAGTADASTGGYYI